MKISAITTFVCLSVLASAASAQTTPAATTAKPVTTPAATTAKPATTPAATTTAPAATPAATSTSPTKYDPVKGCWSVSVERDATYCIAGPICSGRGAQPAGWNCPKKGDVATERCLSYLASWVPASKSCVAPVDAECKVIKTGAWGCVLKGDTTSTGPTPAPTKTGGNSGAGGNGGNGGAGGNGTTPVTPGNGTTGGNSTTNSTRPAGKPDNGTIQAPTKLVNLNAAAAGGSGSAAAVGAVAAVAAVAMAAIGTVLYKKHQKKTAEVEDEEDVVDVVTP